MLVAQDGEIKLLRERFDPLAMAQAQLLASTEIAPQRSVRYTRVYFGNRPRLPIGGRYGKLEGGAVGRTL
jgi:hypothetical protein